MRHWNVFSAAVHVALAKNVDGGMPVLYTRGSPAAIAHAQATGGHAHVSDMHAHGSHNRAQRLGMGPARDFPRKISLEIP